MATITTKPSLTIKRRFKAAPSKVFSAWTDPEKVKHWMGPERSRCCVSRATPAPAAASVG